MSVAGAWASTAPPPLSPAAAAAAATASSPSQLPGSPMGWYKTLEAVYPGNSRTSYATASWETGDLQQQLLLDGSLGMSAAAVAGSAAAIEAAGEMLHPYNAPCGAMAYQQTLLQQQQLPLQQVAWRQQPQQQQQYGHVLPPVWNDPVAQALQGEVQQLRQEVCV